jgi:rare lipoprotein A
MNNHLRILAAMLVATTLAACGSAPRQGGSTTGSAGSASSPRGGGFYLDDGPGTDAPANLDAIPDAVPRTEPLHRGTQRPYVVMGRSYTPMTRIEPYKARGIATWYGRRYHGKPTSSGEPYDMYAMTAAHTVLPIPSYVRVTNVANGKSVVVRVNDRGPFIGDRLIDLSYTAAHKLGIIGSGSGMVEVESIMPGSAAAAPPPVAAARPLAEPALESAPLPPVNTTPATAPPATTTAPAVAPAPASAPAPGSYLQFGAFGMRTNAESLVARLQSQADWLTGQLQVVQSDNLFRVQAGPYPSEAAAREAAERANQALGSKPVLVTR